MNKDKEQVSLWINEFVETDQIDKYKSQIQKHYEMLTPVNKKKYDSFMEYLKEKGVYNEDKNGQRL